MSTKSGIVGYVTGFFTGEIAKKIWGKLFEEMSGIVIEKTKDALKIQKGGKGKADELIHNIVNLNPIISEPEKYEFTLEHMKTIEGYMGYLGDLDKANNSYLLPDFILYIAQGALSFTCGTDKDGNKTEGEARDISNSLAFLKRLSMEPNHPARKRLCDNYRIWEEHNYEKLLLTTQNYLKDFGKGAKQVGTKMIENAKTALPAPQPGSTDSLESLKDKAKAWRDSQRLKRR